MFDGDKASRAVGVPLYYGFIEAVFIGLYLVAMWGGLVAGAAGRARGVGVVELAGRVGRWRTTRRPPRSRPCRRRRRRRRQSLSPARARLGCLLAHEFFLSKVPLELVRWSARAKTSVPVCLSSVSIQLCGPPEPAYKSSFAQDFALSAAFREALAKFLLLRASDHAFSRRIATLPAAALQAPLRSRRPRRASTSSRPRPWSRSRKLQIRPSSRTRWPNTRSRSA